MNTNDTQPPSAPIEANEAAGGDCPCTTCYASFWGKLLKKWDWWIYCRAHKSLWRMCENEPAYGYLMELQIQHWNARQRLPESLKRATETFHASLMDSQHNA